MKFRINKKRLAIQAAKGALISAGINIGLGLIFNAPALLKPAYVVSRAIKAAIGWVVVDVVLSIAESCLDKMAETQEAYYETA